MEFAMSKLKPAFLLGIFLLAVVCLAAGCDRSGPVSGSQASSAAKSAGAASSPQSPVSVQPPAQLEVEVEIDFRNSTPPLLGKVTLEKEQTAFAALESFARQKELKVTSKGNGETTFVMGIGEVANQGAGGINWTYWVNGKLGDRSSGVFSLKPGDKVSWIFGKYP
jgi:hypothetical protein